MLLNVLIILLYLIVLPALLLLLCLFLLGTYGLNLWKQSFKVWFKGKNKKDGEDDYGGKKLNKYYKKEKHFGDEEGEYVEYIDITDSDEIENDITDLK